MSKRMFVFFLIVALACLAGPQSPATAATTGKIAGRVTDDRGGSLTGANVVIVGMQRGATADMEGFYTILLVEPGIYELEASLIGYQKVRKQVVRVVVGYTTTVDFRLRETTLEAAEIVVTAERPPVEPDKTASKHYVTAEDIELAPLVKDVASWAGLQPGVQADGRSVRQGNFSMATPQTVNTGTPNDKRTHGFDYTVPKPISITYTVDGVRMVNNDSRAANMFTGVNRSSIQEISVVTGVPEAEYGNMDAGIINIVTKRGGRDYHVFVEYRYTLPGQRHFGFNAYDPIVHINPSTGRSRMRLNDSNWLQEGEDIGADGIPGTDDDTGRLVHVQPDDYTEVAGHRLEGSVSGPVGSKATFHVSATTDMKVRQRPWPDLRTLPNMQLTGKLSFSLTPQINLKVGGVFGRSQEFRVMEGSALSPLNDGRDLFLPAGESGSGREIVWDAMGYAVLTHALSPRTLYELRVSRSDSKRDTRDIPDDTEKIVRDADGWFTVERNVRDFRLDRQTRHNVKVDFFSQITKGNFFKTGVDATWYRTWQWEPQNPTGQSGNFLFRTLFDYAGAGANRFGKDGRMDFVPVRPGTNNLPDFAAAGSLDDPAWTGFKDYPARAFELSAYVQDKMEFEGMVVNVGLRMDSFFHRTQTRTEAMWQILPHFTFLQDMLAGLYRQSQNPYPNDPTAFPTWKGNRMFKVSPRFGVSHPITDRSSIHFAYGRFFVLPIFFSMYGNVWSTGSGLTIHEDLNGDGRLSSYEYYGGMQTYGRFSGGNAEIDGATTTNYEVGADWNFVSDYTAQVTAFYRRSEAYGQNSATYFRDPVKKAEVRADWVGNNYSGETRGLELAVSKRLSNYFSFRASYSWYWEQNNRYGRRFHNLRWYPDSSFIGSGAYSYKSDIDPETGERVWLPLTEQEIQAFGAYADKQIQTQITSEQELIPTEKFKDQLPWIDEVGLPFTDEKNIAVRGWRTNRASVRGPSDQRDAPSDGSFSLLFATPPEFGPNVKGVHLLGDLNMNFVLRMEMGTYYRYRPNVPTPSTKGQIFNSRLMYRDRSSFRTDLGVQKGFRVGRFHPAVFFEATNLFNGKKPRPIRVFSQFNELPLYGLAQGEPTPGVERDSNVVWDPFKSFFNRSREIYFGLRMSL